MTISLRLGFLLVTAALVTVAQAEQFETFGEYTVHYSAFTTDVLSKEMAKTYDISRSRNRALLNISILKKRMGSPDTPVRAKVKVTAANLSAQLRQLEVRELTETGAVYYLAETGVAHGEVLTYTVEVLPAGARTPYNFSFQQQFVTDY